MLRKYAIEWRARYFYSDWLVCDRLSLATQSCACQLRVRNVGSTYMTTIMPRAPPKKIQ
ncbi:MAG: hypothetical protein HC849_34305 [Oscillatoriales cyanobacterium RU_3_3]|nr:hypothetical protein [Oscillatoriales cyanobacterium RU_3_3]